MTASIRESRKKRMLLHIGRHKTGTSSIQRFLFDNPRLLEAHGFDYPNSLINNGFAHHALAEPLARRHFRQPNAIVERARRVEAASASLNDLGADRVSILSSEAFQNCDPRLIAEILDGIDVTVLVYVRNELDYVASAYAQRVHATRYSYDLATFAEDFTVDYVQFLDSWSNYFDLRVRIFDREHLVGGDVVTDFITTGLGMAPDVEIRKPADQNPSLNRKFVAFKRLLNSGDRLDDDANRQIYQPLATLSSEDCSSGKFRIDEKVKQALLPHFSNRQSGWTSKYFGVGAIFDYHAVETAEPYAIDAQEFESVVDALNQRRRRPLTLS